jgi:hypothetical protein
MAITGNTAGLVPEVIQKLTSISTKLNKDVHVTSGKRNGSVNASPHNSGIGADISIANMKSVAITDECVEAGFSGVGEYWKSNNEEDLHAHGDIRGLPGSENSGAYKAGGAKSSPLCWHRIGPESDNNYTYGSRKSGHSCPQLVNFNPEMMFREKSFTENAISSLNVQAAFKLIKFYENAASIIKGRIWTITSWILIINSALMTFAFQLYIEHPNLNKFLIIQGIICTSGIILSMYLFAFIRDQGNHLIHYWTKENKVGAWNKDIQHLVFDNEKDIVDAKKEEYVAPYPKFCQRLQLLPILYGIGFVCIFIFMYI